MELRGAVVGAECTVSAMRSLALLRCSVFECTDAKQETRIKGDASTRAVIVAAAVFCFECVDAKQEARIKSDASMRSLATLWRSVLCDPTPIKRCKAKSDAVWTALVSLGAF